MIPQRPMSCLDVGGTELTCRSTWTIAAVHVWLMQEMAVADVGGVVAVCSWQVRRYVRVCMTVKSCRVSKKRQLSGRSFHTCPRQSLSRRANTIQEVVASLNSRLCLGQERPLSCSFFDASSSLSSPLTNYFFPCTGYYDITSHHNKCKLHTLHYLSSLHGQPLIFLSNILSTLM